MEMLPNYFEKVEGGKAIEKLLASFGYTLVARLSQDRLYIHKPWNADYEKREDRDWQYIF